MFPILYNNITAGVVPTDFGLGVLMDCISCTIVEERNGIYELTLKYPSSGVLAKEIVNRNIILAKPNYTDDPQLFRIYNIGKELNNSFTVKARHISYDLSGFPITTGSATNVSTALQLLHNSATAFTFSTDKSVNANFAINTPSSVRSWLGGKEGSILDIYGTGEYKYNNYNIQFLANRGTNRGVQVRYGKNLTKLSNTDDSNNMATGIIAYWKSTDNVPVTIISNTISTGISLDIISVNVIDASSYFKTKPTVAQLNTYATNYISSHNTTSISKNFKFDFAQIGQFSDRVDLCDTITIIYDDFNISATVKCISTTWDVLTEKYIQIEVGEPKTNIADTIVGINKTVTDQLSPNQVKGAIETATSLITGNSGGYIVMHDSNGDGTPDELLIMNTKDITTATKVWRWNLAGLGYSSTGYNGSYGLAITMDGSIVADKVNTGNLVFGSGGNVDGKLEIRDINGTVICRFDKTGATVKGSVYATEFTAEASSGFKAIVGDLDIVEAPYYLSRHGIYLLDTDATTRPNYPRVALQNLDNSGSGQLILTDNLGRPNIYTNESQLSLLSHYPGEQSTTSYIGVTTAEIAAYNSTTTKDDCYGKIQVVSKNVNNKRNQLKYDGSDPSNIYLGPLFVQNGTMYGIDMRNISLSAPNSGVSTIYSNGTSGNITCISLTQTSSRKYKDNIENLSEEEALKILQLNPVTYDFINKEKGINMRGFIAEDVNEVIPALVKKEYMSSISSTDEDGNNIVEDIILDEPEVSLDYSMLTPYLTKVAQIQQNKLDLLNAEIIDLSVKNVELVNKLDSLEKELEGIKSMLSSITATNLDD